MFWIIAFVLASIAAFFIVSPLFRAGSKAPSADSNDAVVYKDQLEEVSRDETDGLIGNEEARQARAEIARRLIAADDKIARGENHLGQLPAISIAVLICLVLPVAGGLFYRTIGMPGAPDLPLAERMSDENPDINILIARTEAHLAAHPEDGKGWEVLAPIYMRRMRTEEAANAYRKAIETLGGDAERYGSLGEALSAGAQGAVTKEARGAFEKALALAPDDPRSRFYIALSDGQAGKVDQAIAEFEALQKDSPKDAPWQQVLAAQLNRLKTQKDPNAAAPGNPNAEDVEAANSLSDADRTQMIRTMVETLDARLQDQPNNFEGWQRLIRSYSVLNDKEKARDALKRGLAAFPANTGNGKALIALASELGIAVEGAGQ